MQPTDPPHTSKPEEPAKSEPEQQVKPETSQQDTPPKPDRQEIGYAVSSRDFLVFLDGMPTVKINDLVIAEDGKRGWVNSLHKNAVEVLMLDEGSLKL